MRLVGRCRSCFLPVCFSYFCCVYIVIICLIRVTLWFLILILGTNVGLIFLHICACCQAVEVACRKVRRRVG